jgi:hypothetical protein
MDTMSPQVEASLPPGSSTERNGDSPLSGPPTRRLEVSPARSAVHCTGLFKPMLNHRWASEAKGIISQRASLPRRMRFGTARKPAYLSSGQGRVAVGRPNQPPRARPWPLPFSIPQLPHRPLPVVQRR